jgi:hypothetical protein
MSLAAGALMFIAMLNPVAADDDRYWGRGMMGRWFMGEMMSDQYGPRWGWGMMMGPRFKERWLGELKSELKITEAQSKLWDDYTSAAGNAAEVMGKLHQQMMKGDIPEKLPDRLTWHETMLSARLESTKSVNAALLSLYEAMSAEQREKADSLFSGMGMM